MFFKIMEAARTLGKKIIKQHVPLISPYIIISEYVPQNARKFVNNHVVKHNRNQAWQTMIGNCEPTYFK